MAKMDADLDIFETSPARNSQNKSSSGGPQSYTRAFSARNTSGGSKHYSGTSVNTATRGYPIMPSTVGPTMPNGRLLHRNVVASPSSSSGRKSNEKYGHSSEQQVHSPSSEDEAYYLSSWTTTKSERSSVGASNTLINHPSSAPSKKLTNSGFARVNETSAWQAGSASKPRHLTGSIPSTLRAESNSNCRQQISGTIGRSRSSSQENDSSFILGNYGSSGNYFTSPKNISANHLKLHVGSGVVMSDFEDEEVCVTSDDDLIHSMDDEIDEEDFSQNDDTLVIYAIMSLISEIIDQFYFSLKIQEQTML